MLQQQPAAVWRDGHLTAAVSGHVQLALNQRVVGAALGQQLGVSAGFDDVALPHNNDDVGVANRRQAVRHDQHRAALHGVLERALHRSLTLGV